MALKGFYLTYEKDGVKKRKDYNSYYQMVIDKKKLEQKGVQVNVVDNTRIDEMPRYRSSEEIKKRDRELVKQFLQRKLYRKQYYTPISELKENENLSSE